jgi:hypothetical protein
VISGTPTRTGDFTPTVTVSAGAEAETGFAWSVIASGGDFFVNPGDVPIPDGVIRSSPRSS